jgi:PD-(D/E)XK nuclease superfamily
MSEPPMEHDRLAREIVDAAFAVHTILGPALLEPVYEQCLVYELEAREIPFQQRINSRSLGVLAFHCRTRRPGMSKRGNGRE